MSPRCACGGPLYRCDLLSGLTTCVECARRALRAARAGTHANITAAIAARNTGQQQASSAASGADEWAIFTDAIRTVAAQHGGQVDWTFVRPLIRGRVEPKHVGQYVKRARRLGLLVEVDHHRSEDHVGKNAGRMEPLYKLGAVA